MIFNPAHPGQVLRDYLGEMTVGEAASRLGVTRAHLSLRLSAALGTSADFWLKMQLQRDLWLAKKRRMPKVRPFPRIAAQRRSAMQLDGQSTATRASG
jgi:addiction module HigA family antidote